MIVKAPDSISSKVSATLEVFSTAAGGGEVGSRRLCAAIGLNAKNIAVVMSQLGNSLDGMPNM
jgi:hypothetical protein